ncbi:unnamed protein product [Mytilus coruscus]|uniref:Uncharacterized protein n=1 Tax=Mytilus coruscus TaxID=42192 RepID=A0A6J8ET75_MYTCO|nr:unnamed protein product [Mytilus coruscus]
MTTSDADGQFQIKTNAEAFATLSAEQKMHERECTISYSATQTGWYGVAIQIEDFNSTGSMEALSSVPLQFLVVVFCLSNSIREIQTASPQGMVKSELDVYANREWYVNISWTPDTGQAGPHIFCYTALDSNGYGLHNSYPSCSSLTTTALRSFGRLLVTRPGKRTTDKCLHQINRLCNSDMDRGQIPTTNLEPPPNRRTRDK